jgi:hypothetical protein
VGCLEQRACPANPDGRDGSDSLGTR